MPIELLKAFRGRGLTGLGQWGQCFDVLSAELLILESGMTGYACLVGCLIHRS